MLCSYAARPPYSVVLLLESSDLYGVKLHNGELGQIQRTLIPALAYLAFPPRVSFHWSLNVEKELAAQLLHFLKAVWKEISRTVT